MILWFIELRISETYTHLETHMHRHGHRHAFMDRKEEIYLLYHWNIDGLSNTKAIKMTYLRLQNVKSGSRRKQAD